MKSVAQRFSVKFQSENTPQEIDAIRALALAVIENAFYDLEPNQNYIRGKNKYSKKMKAVYSRRQKKTIIDFLRWKAKLWFTSPAPSIKKWREFWFGLAGVSVDYVVRGIKHKLERI